MTHLFLTVLNYGCVTKCSDLRHARSFFFLSCSNLDTCMDICRLLPFLHAALSRYSQEQETKKNIDGTCRETERKWLTKTEKKRHSIHL